MSPRRWRRGFPMPASISTSIRAASISARSRIIPAPGSASSIPRNSTACSATSGGTISRSRKNTTRREPPSRADRNSSDPRVFGGGLVSLPWYAFPLLPILPPLPPGEGRPSFPLSLRERVGVRVSPHLPSWRTDRPHPPHAAHGSPPSPEGRGIFSSVALSRREGQGEGALAVAANLAEK